MFRKKVSLPKSNGNFYLTYEFLTKLKNGKKVRIQKIANGSMFFSFATGKEKVRLLLKPPEEEGILKSTFVFYVREDGKHEESRLDKLLEVKVDVKDLVIMGMFDKVMISF